MTLIATSINQGHPFLTADILITEDNGKPDLQLPNRLEGIPREQFEQLSSQPTSFLQKLYIMEPNVCVCLAGNILTLKAFLQDLRIFCRIKSNDGRIAIKVLDLKNFFEGYDDAVLKELSCGIMIVEGNAGDNVEIYEAHYGQWIHGDTVVFGQVFVSGSGAAQYVKHLQVHASKAADPDKTSEFRTREVTFTFLVKLLAKERLTLDGINASWGAFLEVCFFDGERFVKNEGLAFILSDAKVDIDGNFHELVPTTFIYNEYHANILHLTTIEVSQLVIEESADSIIFESDECEHILFSVGEIDREIPAEATNVSPGFFTNEIALSIMLELPNGAKMTMSIYTTGYDVAVEFSGKGTIKFTWPKVMHEIVARTVKSLNPAFRELDKDDECG
ncbi:MAG: hypothetical protein DI535_00775 [Citrobacter freundii]|nr:MAG: hypothetical protein DI535_00775 [Citrobacter freundii]